MTLPILYHTDGCHLCEEAKALLAELAVTVDQVDIFGDSALQQRYGWRIPVVRCGDGELDWPFTVTELANFLTQQRASSI